MKEALRYAKLVLEIGKELFISVFFWFW